MPAAAIALKRSPTGRAASPRITVTTQIDPAVRDRLARLAVAHGRSFSSLVREAIEKLSGEYERKAARR